MFIEQLFTACLSENAYYIESAGEAVVIDPLRDIGAYLDLARKRGARIKYIFETHFHADFISGHLDLARETGALIVFGPGARASYQIHESSDGEELAVGQLAFRVLHTPGHTLESCCYLLLDDRHNPHSIFTGDTVFIGDVGRPDLAVSSDLSRETLAGMLYDSIQKKIMPLPDYVVIYPGHGAGSACGKSIGSGTHSTVGEQKLTNYALQAGSREEFVQAVTDGLQVPPPYFFMDAQMNRNGYRPLNEVMESNNSRISVQELQQLLRDHQVLVLDTRKGSDFCKGFITGAIQIGIDGVFAVTAGTVLDPATPLVLVTDTGREEEAVMRLARIGFENVKGVLDGGFRAWSDAGLPTDKITCVSPQEFERQFRFNHCYAIDVRNPDEWIPGFVAGAQLIPLSSIDSKSGALDKNRDCYVYCGGGYRSMVAASILKRKGFTAVKNVEGGMALIRKTKIPVRQLSVSSA